MEARLERGPRDDGFTKLMDQSRPTLRNRQADGKCIQQTMI